MVVILRRFNSYRPTQPKAPKPKQEPKIRSGGFTSEQDQKIIESIRLGRSYSEIGALMNKTRCAIAGRAKRLRDSGREMPPPNGAR